ncbi:MAG: tryptophan synthase alpha chain [Hyalangium sp.]|uniref:tryptophan synthase alpha chain n=1 Tax=Hyalangium sp. TaxID=2028555 RepID=UPI00389A7FBE
MRRGGGLGWGLCLVGLWLSACNTTVMPGDESAGRQRSLCQPMTCESQGMDCGITIDGCGGTLHCGDCPEGRVCGGGGTPNVCAPAPCQPGTCGSLGKNCGAASDGCGGTLQCGTCTAPQTCGGGGLANVCGLPVCTPTTCSALGKNCGTLQDGCGGMLECGACPEGEACGGGGAPNVCGKASCQPATCASLGKNCGTVSDGCGGTLECGTCPEGQACGGGAVPNVCEGAACVRATCASLGKNCGAVPDGCGGTLNCGECSGEETCGGGGTPNVCGARVCRPYSCGLLEKNCGPVPDGCGGTLQCGTCTAPESCGASGVSGVCYTSQSVCVDQDLGSTLPVTVKGTTAFSNDDHHASCGGASAPDRGFLWTAPKRGTFVLDTARSAFRSMLVVRRGGCGGEELACATEGISYGGGARVTVSLEAGQTVLVVVDSPSTGAFNSGYFELHIDELRESEAGSCFDGRDNDGDRWVDCADTDCQGDPRCGGSGCANQDLGSALPVTTFGETVDSGDGFQGTCGMPLQQDRAHLWTAPKSGTFVFDTAGSGWSNALYILTGCRGTELACAVGKVGGKQAAAKLTLTQGQSVLIVVDGMANAETEEPIRYTLHISEYAPNEVGRCQDGADNDGDGEADQRDSDCR